MPSLEGLMCITLFSYSVVFLVSFFFQRPECSWWHKSCAESNWTGLWSAKIGLETILRPDGIWAEEGAHRNWLLWVGCTQMSSSISEFSFWHRAKKNLTLILLTDFWLILLMLHCWVSSGFFIVSLPWWKFGQLVDICLLFDLAEEKL